MAKAKSFKKGFKPPPPKKHRNKKDTKAISQLDQLATQNEKEIFNSVNVPISDPNNRSRQLLLSLNDLAQTSIKNSKQTPKPKHDINDLLTRIDKIGIAQGNATGNGLSNAKANSNAEANSKVDANNDIDINIDV